MSLSVATWPARSVILDLLAPWLLERRWFPASSIEGAQVIHYADFAGSDDLRVLVIQLAQGAWVHVPLAWKPTWSEAGRIIDLDDGGVLVDALYDREFLTAWIDQTHRDGGLGVLPDQDGPAIAAQLRAAVADARHLGQEQSNTSLIFPASPPAIVKFFRVLVVGEHPEIAVPLALAGDGFESVPEPLGYSTMMVTGLDHEAEETCTGVVSRLVSDAEDGFAYFVERARADEDPADAARALGEMTRSMHEHLRASLGESEPMSGAALALRIHGEARQAMAASSTLAADTNTLERLDRLTGMLQHVGALPPAQRIHGDYHLGQCLRSDRSWYVLDFEGEPLRPLAERIQPDQRLRDVAGIIRSFDYARAIGNGSSAWCATAQDAFVRGYFGEDGPGEAERMLLGAFVVEKSLYEIRYEAQQRPAWETIPATALREELINLPE
ncbi:phosphotransferase [Nanchangia anserum]|uniref:Phosphotransferase n=1 Tax=Nanchangia anserum TaxID=2692125 RepID=A0A8I0KS02_9ACTO|nr:phosphotransferase [Nanchangia anserum]MBD3689917.1 phosphotransferase [Nanchangia anserum]QOX82267.1 phosphotransferase [Nanchangia anserum]